VPALESFVFNCKALKHKVSQSTPQTNTKGKQHLDDFFKSPSGAKNTEIQNK
jgi:hypothetical protein